MNTGDWLLLVGALTVASLSLRNATAFALAAQYAAVKGYYWWLDEAMPSTGLIMSDIFVIAVIYCKPPARDCWPYPDRWNQFCALWGERSLWDRIVIGGFFAAWIVNVLPLSTNQFWWSLWTVAMAQYVAASIEGFDNFFAARKANAGKSRPGPPSAGLEYRWSRGAEGYV